MGISIHASPAACLLLVLSLATIALATDTPDTIVGEDVAQVSPIAESEFIAEGKPLLDDFGDQCEDNSQCGSGICASSCSSLDFSADDSQLCICPHKKRSEADDAHSENSNDTDEKVCCGCITSGSSGVTTCSQPVPGFAAAVINKKKIEKIAAAEKRMKTEKEAVAEKNAKKQIDAVKVPQIVKKQMHKVLKTQLKHKLKHKLKKKLKHKLKKKMKKKLKKKLMKKMLKRFIEDKNINYKKLKKKVKKKLKKKKKKKLHKKLKKKLKKLHKKLEKQVNKEMEKEMKKDLAERKETAKEEWDVAKKAEDATSTSKLPTYAREEVENKVPKPPEGVTFQYELQGRRKGDLGFGASCDHADQCASGICGTGCNCFLQDDDLTDVLSKFIDTDKAEGCVCSVPCHFPYKCCGGCVIGRDPHLQTCPRGTIVTTFAGTNPYTKSKSTFLTKEEKMAAPVLKKERVKDAKDASAKIQEKGAAAMKYIMKADKEAHKEARKAFLKKEEQLAAPVIEKKKEKKLAAKKAEKKFLKKEETLAAKAHKEKHCTFNCE